METPAAISLLLPALVFGPLLAAALLPLLKHRPLHDIFLIVCVGLPLVGLIALAPSVLQGQTLTGSVPGLLGAFHFSLDPFGLVFALTGNFVWLCATIYAIAYTREDPARIRFLSMLLVLLGSSHGVVLAGDLLTLFVFFELLGLTALLVVVHTGSEEARAAGVKYFWLTFAGGLALLAGVVLVMVQSDSLAWAPLPESVSSAWRWAIFALLLIGFGVKAGMVPLHVWLPAAHPVAPAPASALLSGVMIKAGAYGVFRSMNMLLRPAGDAASWDQLFDMGLVLTTLGIVTLVTGVVMALLQNSIKRMLAWSSVSQMGFILTGLGAGAVLGGDGAMATAGSLLHIVNHALFKSCLFLAAGAIALRCGSTQMDQLGGLWRRMPVTFTCVLIAAAGIAGVPLFNGFVSKSMIHHGLVDASQQAGAEFLLYGEWLYLAAAAGTIAYFSRFLYLVFLRPAQSTKAKQVTEASPLMLAGMLLLVGPIVWLGLYPDTLLQHWLAPGFSAWAVSAAPISDYLASYFLGRGDVLSFAGTLAVGLTLCVAGLRTRLFRHLQGHGAGPDRLYQHLGPAMIAICLWLSDWATAIRQAVPVWLLRLYHEHLRPGWRALPGLRQRIGHEALLSLRATADFLLQGRLLRRQIWRDLLLRLRTAAEFMIDASLVDHLDRRQVSENRRESQIDQLYTALDLQRDRLILSADRLARQSDDSPGNDELINISHMMAGWIGTEWLDRAMAEGSSKARRLADSEAFCQQLAEKAVVLAQRYRAGELTEPDLEAVAEALRETLGTDDKPAAVTWPERSWPAEITSLALAPDRGHWPVSESLEQGIFISAARGRIMKVARDLSSGLLVAFVILLGLALAASLMR